MENLDELRAFPWFRQNTRSFQSSPLAQTELCLFPKNKKLKIMIH